MTLVSQIITDAYHENNLIPEISVPNANQVTKGLNRLNRILLSTVGNEAGDGLTEYNVDGEFSDQSLTNPWLPDNARMMLNLTSAKSYDLDPYPQEGQRFAVVDVLGNLATYNVTLNGNGRLIEGATSLVLNTDDLYAQWLYRSDIGNWVRITTLADDDEMPFPVEFDDYFITLLAVRLNPTYGQMLPAETQQMLTRSRSQLRSRYRITKQVESDLSAMNWYSDDNLYNGYNEHNFSAGRPYKWH